MLNCLQEELDDASDEYSDDEFETPSTNESETKAYGLQNQGVIRRLILRLIGPQQRNEGNAPVVMPRELITRVFENLQLELQLRSTAIQAYSCILEKLEESNQAPGPDIGLKFIFSFDDESRELHV